MKKLLSLILLFATLTICSAVNVNVCSSVIVPSVSNNYIIEGQTSYNIGTSTSGVGGSYSLSPNLSPGAIAEWTIKGNRGYVYPNGENCSINIYEPGQYRLSCVITESDGSFTEVAIYITVMP